MSSSLAMWRFTFLFFTTAASAASIWPLPVSLSSGSSVLWIDENVKVVYTGPQASYASPLDTGSQVNSTDWTSKIVTNAVQRTYDTLFNQNFVPWMFHPRMSDFEPSPVNNTVYVSSISLKQNKPDPTDIMKPSVGGVDESYLLSMSTAGVVAVVANSSIGLSYGLTTLTQLFYAHSAGGVYTPYAPTTVLDAPKFAWRGLNVDTARTFKPVAQLYATIDSLAFNKFNRLHWHVTDAQAWPLVIPSMPDLAGKGAYAATQIYSPADVRALYEYGAVNGVEVVMEIDQPGHTTAIGYAYPDLIAAFNIQPDWATYAAEPPSGQLKLNDSQVSAFLDALFDDLLPRLAPLSQYFHLGGDEVNANVYLLEAAVASNSSAVLVPLLQAFMDRNQDQLRAANFTPLVWQEQLLTWNLTLPKNTIVQAWEPASSLLEIVNKGYYALAGDYDFWYLDCGHGTWVSFYPGLDERSAWPFLDYCNPLKNWKLIYSYDPLEGIPADRQHLVLGGEVHIWSEQTDASNLDTMLWPRACAAGEVLWSGARDAAGRNRSQIEAAPRLNQMRERLVARGLRAEPPQMPFCTQDGPMQCNS